jgi:hypothetical protein
VFEHGMPVTLYLDRYLCCEQFGKDRPSGSFLHELANDKGIIFVGPGNVSVMLIRIPLLENRPVTKSMHREIDSPFYQCNRENWQIICWWCFDRLTERTEDDG